MKPKVLLVDDDVDTGRMYGMMLEHHGIVPLTAETPALALATFEAAQPVAAIVLDLGLQTSGDGLEVLREIRRTSAVPCIVLSGRSDRETRRRAEDLGCDRYLTKPLGPRDLLEEVLLLIPETSARESSSNG